MNLINIKGDMFYIKYRTNTGVYAYDNNRGLIIDPELGGKSK